MTFGFVDRARCSVELVWAQDSALYRESTFIYTSDFPEALLDRPCDDSSIDDDSFAITIGDDYEPNPKSLPPINIFVDNSAQRPLENCPGPSGEATGQRAAALKKCKKKFPGKAKTKKRKKCKQKANLLPV